MICNVEGKIHFFHNWSKWEDIKEGKVEKKYEGERDYNTIGTVFVQKRVCKACGLVQQKLTTLIV